MKLAVIIPANNEEAFIEGCLQALAAQTGPVEAHVIVSANACRDRTVALAEAHAQAFAARGHGLVCLDSDIPGKMEALTRAEAAIPPAFRSAPRAYLDADVLCDPELLTQVGRALDTDAPRYATGTIRVRRSANAFTRAYAKVWEQLPFVQDGAVGAGFFAVNAAGRARWQGFPKIISDDTFVRLNFTPDERIEVPASYHWPMVEGYRSLVRVRRRQDAGVREVYHHFPHLQANEAKTPVTSAVAARIFRRMPLAFLLYMLVHVSVRMAGPSQGWSRGR
jgi:hypothetical protein